MKIFIFKERLGSMKKSAGLCIGEKFDQQLLGLNEKYDLLFIRKDQELILFSLETLEEISRYRCSGIPEVTSLLKVKIMQ